MDKISIGRIVHYKLNGADAEAINRRRSDFKAAVSGNSGHIGHVGNSAEAGQVYPATVVRTWGYPTVNLQVLLDGNDTYWATSRGEGGSDGQWHWPERD